MTDLWKRAIGFRAAAWACRVAGAALLLLTFWRGWLGRPFAVPHVIYVEKPIPHLLAGLGAFLAGWFLVRGRLLDARGWARVAGRGVLLAFSLALSFLMLEVGYRVLLKRAKQQNTLARLQEAHAKGEAMRVHSTSPLASIVEVSADHALGYELQPNLNKDFGHHSLRTNADGLREDRNYTPGRLAGGLRIIGLGDSGMFGWSCDQGEGYMEVLEDLLRARGGAPCEVLNLAVPGYNTQLEVEMLRWKGLKYEPDIVVVGWCDNDYQLPFFVVDEGAFRRRDVSFLYALCFDRSRLEDLCGGVAKKPEPHGEAGPRPAAKPGQAPDPAPVAAALRELSALSREHGFKVLVFGPMDDQVIGLCRQMKIDCFNTLAKVDASAYPAEWAVHFMHPRPEGHRVLAEHLARELERLGWLTPARNGAPVPSRPLGQG